MTARPGVLRAVRGRLRSAAQEGKAQAQQAVGSMRETLARRLPVRIGTPIIAPIAIRATVWTGGDAEPFDGVVLVGSDGRIEQLGPAGQVTVPEQARRLGDPGMWVGPGVIDTHVHLALGDIQATVAGGALGVRDLGAPVARVRSWQPRHESGPLRIAVAGPIITAPGGYPSRSWGAGGFAAPVEDAAGARTAVHTFLGLGASVIKIALEPGPRWPVPQPRIVQAVVRAAHDAGVPVIAHALRVDMVTRALDAGVDQLAHTPTELLPEALAERIAAQGVVVCSTIQTFFSDGIGVDVAKNAAGLVRAGVTLVYGTDLGNAGTAAGVDPRELDRLANAGLGRRGALLAATRDAAVAVGFGPQHAHLRAGDPARLVLLHDDPLVEPGVWRHPVAVLSAGRLLAAEPTPTKFSGTVEGR